MYRTKIRQIIFLVGSNKPGSFHIICETQSGHMLEFSTTKEHDFFAPFLFEGRIRGCRKKYADRLFGKRYLFGIPLGS
jgi:hypothetical protein